MIHRICWLLVVLSIVAWWGFSFAQGQSSHSPHGNPQDLLRVNCRNCHLEKPEGSSATMGEKQGENLRPDYSQKCFRCHEEKLPQSCLLISSKEVSLTLMRQIPDLPLPLFQNQISCPSCHTTHQVPDKEKNPFLLRSAYQPFRALSETIDPHQSGVFCFLCHEKEPRPGDKELYLKSGGNTVQLCKSCHNNKRVRADNHPVEIVPSTERGVKVPAEFPLKKGKLTCISCHKMNCAGGERTKNSFFLRGGPYQRRIDTCLVCHIREQYEKINPHDQVTDAGEIREDRCLFCHDINKENATGLAFKFKASFKFYCLGCHPISVEKHPFGASHTGRQLHTIWEGLKPSERNKLSQQEKFKMFPISISGKIMCATCHNPHDVRKGPKLRINDVNKSCRQCHYKKYGQIVQKGADETDRWITRKAESAAIQETPSQNDLDPAGEDKVAFGYRASLHYYCLGCHANKETNHPYGVVHTGKFVERFWENKFKDSSQAASGICSMGDGLDMQIFPLTLSGQIGCFTCHDPHNGAKGPKLRVESKESLCSVCHPNRSAIIEKYLKSVSNPKDKNTIEEDQGSGKQEQGSVKEE
ncbi:MAG: cytochrome c3 family protein [bacterium]